MEMRSDHLLATLAVWLAWCVTATHSRAPWTAKDINQFRLQPGKYFRELNLSLLMMLSFSTDEKYRRVEVSCRPWRKHDHQPLTIASFNQHYDGRFADRPLEETEQKAAVRVLIQTYLATFRDLGVETWIMHGSLLGWWWNKQALPWDDDADVMVTEPSMYYLAAYHNMTTYYYQYSAIPEGRTFLLDINPHYTTRSESDTLNVVDARWIDMENGLFIDITAARYDLDHPQGEGVMICKDGHEFRVGNSGLVTGYC